MNGSELSVLGLSELAPKQISHLSTFLIAEQILAKILNFQKIYRLCEKSVTE